MEAQIPSQTPVQGENKLPSIGFFVLDGYKYKYALPSVHAIDCVKYVSRSGLTFQGCMKVSLEGNVVKDEELPGGLYGSFIEPLISLSTRRKMSRNIVELKSFIVELIGKLKENLEIDGKELLVFYDNNTIEIYDKYVRAVDIPLEEQNFILSKKHGPHEIKLYKLDNYTLSIDDLEKYLTNTIEHPLRIVTDKEALIELWTPWRQFYSAILLIANDSVRITIGDGSGVITSPGLYLILIH